MTWRVVMMELKQEPATFNPVATRYNGFLFTISDDISAVYRDAKTEIAKAMDLVANDGRSRIVPTTAVAAVSAGPNAGDDLDRLLKNRRFEEGTSSSARSSQRSAAACCVSYNRTCHD